MTEFLIPVLAMLVVPALVWRYQQRRLRRTFAEMPTSGGGSVGLELAEGQSASWHSTASATWPKLVVAGLVPGVAFAVFLGVSNLVAENLYRGGLWLVIALCGAVFAAEYWGLGNVRVWANRSGLTVAFGVLPLSRIFLPVEGIRSASSAHVEVDSLGRGYRGARVLRRGGRLAGTASLATRDGEALMVQFDEAAELLVTVDNAEVGAGFLNDMVAAK